MPTGSNPSPATTVALDGVSVRYRMAHEPVSGIKEYMIRLMQRRLSYEHFWAVRKVSFQIERGEVFGIVGRNGSGKSTLLKVIARVLHPTEGRVRLWGRLAPLLELGAGFHPELTGRENVYLNSALLGRTRTQIDRLLPAIVDFAEVHDFIDAPLRTFSTGMVARLGFSVATAVRPDILLVDEVLSVGDFQFQQKCLDRMYAFQEQGTTIVIVSHSMPTIEAFCTRALWLSQGLPAALGPVSEVVSQYIQFMEGGGTGHEAEPFEPRVLPSAAPPQVENLPTEITGEPNPSPDGDYVSLEETGRLYPAEGVLNPAQGALSLWMRFNSQRPYRDTVVFHTDDSRFVLYVGSYESPGSGGRLRVLVGRAGGNRRVLSALTGEAVYPEVSLTLDSLSLDPDAFIWPDNRWRLVTMTWSGYPRGRFFLFLDGQLAGECAYDPRHNDQRSLPHSISVGYRPLQWSGEVVEKADGTVADSRPASEFALADSNLEIQDLRVYPKFLSGEEIRRMMSRQKEQL